MTTKQRIEYENADPEVSVSHERLQGTKHCTAIGQSGRTEKQIGPASYWCVRTRHTHTQTHA
jgi:hypothetical protein